MPNIITSNLPTPKDDVEFQEIIRDLFAAHWKDDNVQGYGRSGQAQQGVDVYLLGNPLKKTQTYAIQCKVRKKYLTEADIKEEIMKAKNFPHKISKFIFTTTMERDTHLQNLIDKYSLEEQKNGNFEINIKFWEDIISLLAEHPKIVEKYYPQFYGKGSRTKTNFHHLNNNNEITEQSPLLVGSLIDLSKSMLFETINKLEKPINFEEFVRYLIFRTSSFCQDSDGREVLDKFQLFIFGYGLGKLRKKIFETISRFGLGSDKNNPNLISDEPIRDLFAETALKNSVPYTPTLSILNDYWSVYQKSLKKQFLDIGNGQSDLYEGLVQVKNRFDNELRKQSFKYPLLIIISNGKYQNCETTDLIRITNEIKKLNIQIEMC